MNESGQKSLCLIWVKPLELKEVVDTLCETMDPDQKLAIVVYPSEVKLKLKDQPPIKSVKVNAFKVA